MGEIIYSLILLAAGIGKRTNLGYNKILYKINNKYLYEYSLKTFIECGFKEIILVINKNDLEYYNNIDSNIKIVFGGKTRLESVAKGLDLITNNYVFIHDAARPYVKKEDIKKLIKELNNFDCLSLYSKSFDTVRIKSNNNYQMLNRDDIYLMQTPQVIKTLKYKNIINEALNDKNNYTDDVSVYQNYYQDEIKFIEGYKYNIKVTTKQDLLISEVLLNE